MRNEQAGTDRRRYHVDSGEGEAYGISCIPELHWLHIAAVSRLLPGCSPHHPNAHNTCALRCLRWPCLCWPESRSMRWTEMGGGHLSFLQAEEFRPPPTLRRWRRDSAPVTPFLILVPPPTLGRWSDDGSSVEVKSIPTGERGDRSRIAARHQRLQPSLHRYKTGGGVGCFHEFWSKITAPPT